MCDDLQELIEAVAMGEVAPDEATRAHLASCPRCAAAVAEAAAVHRMLSATRQPEAPPEFVRAVTARVRKARWRSEQTLDAAFNVAVGLAVAAGLGALYVVLALSGMTAVGADVVTLFVSGLRTAAESALPQLPLYGVATLLFVSAFGIWWWAEGGM
jgi:anti-sigma factor RsiW